MLWLGCGREDKMVSFSSIQSFSDMLTEKKVKHLAKYAPLLFQD